MNREAVIFDMDGTLADVSGIRHYLIPKDHRKDYLVKSDILRQIRARFEPIHAWDDNPAIIRLWNEQGIPCTVVPGWEVLD